MVAPCSVSAPGLGHCSPKMTSSSAQSLPWSYILGWLRCCENCTRVVFLPFTLSQTLHPNPNKTLALLTLSQFLLPEESNWHRSLSWSHQWFLFSFFLFDEIFTLYIWLCCLSVYYYTSLRGGIIGETWFSCNATYDFVSRREISSLRSSFRQML